MSKGAGSCVALGVIGVGVGSEDDDAVEEGGETGICGSGCGVGAGAAAVAATVVIAGLKLAVAGFVVAGVRELDAGVLMKLFMVEIGRESGTVSAGGGIASEASRAVTGGLQRIGASGVAIDLCVDSATGGGGGGNGWRASMRGNRCRLVREEEDKQSGAPAN